MQRSRSKGFTLIELVIVVLIISILASVAYINYAKYAYRSRRADGKNLIAAAASAEERYYTNYNKYSNSPATIGAASTSDKGYYTLTITNPTGDQSYRLTATPVSPQDKDTGCMNLSLDNTGTKTQTGNLTNGPCW